MIVHVLFSLTRGTPDAGAFWRVIQDKAVDCCRKHQGLMKEVPLHPFEIIL